MTTAQPATAPEQPAILATDPALLELKFGDTRARIAERLSAWALIRELRRQVGRITFNRENRIVAHGIVSYVTWDVLLWKGRCALAGALKTCPADQTAPLEYVGAKIRAAMLECIRVERGWLDGQALAIGIKVKEHRRTEEHTANETLEAIPTRDWLPDRRGRPEFRVPRPGRRQATTPQQPKVCPIEKTYRTIREQIIDTYCEEVVQGEIQRLLRRTVPTYIESHDVEQIGRMEFMCAIDTRLNNSKSVFRESTSGKEGPTLLPSIAFQVRGAMVRFLLEERGHVDVDVNAQRLARSRAGTGRQAAPLPFRSKMCLPEPTAEQKANFRKLWSRRLSILGTQRAGWFVSWWGEANGFSETNKLLPHQVEDAVRMFQQHVNTEADLAQIITRTRAQVAEMDRSATAMNSAKSEGAEGVLLELVQEELEMKYVSYGYRFLQPRFCSLSARESYVADFEYFKKFKDSKPSGSNDDGD